MSGRSWRPTSSTSSNPAVVTSVTRAPLRSSSVFVATVEPWRTRVSRPAPARASASSTASAGARGVDGSLNATRAPSRHATTSVNVPPVSTPTATAGGGPAGGAGAGAGLRRGRPGTLPPALDSEHGRHDGHEYHQDPRRDRELVSEPGKEREVRRPPNYDGGEVTGQRIAAGGGDELERAVGKRRRACDHD